MAQGFSREEAEQFSWLYKYMNYGRYAGVAAGLAFVYLCDRPIMQASRKFPMLRFSPNLVRFIVVFGFYKLGENLTTCRYLRTNTMYLASLYRNNLWTRNKEALARNFHVMNRKFLPEEREMFIVNRDIQRIGRRLFKYNPAIHAGTEEEEATKARLLNDGVPPYRIPSIVEQIREQNKERIAAGEQLRLEPFRPLEVLDKEGYKFGIRFFRGFSHRNVLD